MSGPKIEKTVRIGNGRTHGGRGYSIFCRIEYTDGRLSITGVEGPLSSGNCLGGCGQIVMSLNEKENRLKISPAPGWTRGMIKRFFAVWEKWHLNDMRAGSPAQTAEIEKHIFPREYSSSHYSWACAILEDAGLQPDAGYIHEGPNVEPGPYKYGSAWLSVPVPADVLEFLEGLPVTDRQPAWV